MPEPYCLGVRRRAALYLDFDTAAERQCEAKPGHSGGCDWAALCTMYIDSTTPSQISTTDSTTSAPAERALVGKVGRRGLGTRGKTSKDCSFRI